MASSKKRKAQNKGLASLSPGITCFLCLKFKEAAGARAFHAHHVCAECAKKLDLKETP